MIAVGLKFSGAVGSAHVAYVPPKSSGANCSSKAVAPIAPTPPLRSLEPGAPCENAYVESFHAQVRLELLDRKLFFNLREVNAAIGNYAYEYNFKQPHGSLGKRPPSLVAQRELPLRPALQFALVMLP